MEGGLSVGSELHALSKSLDGIFASFGSLEDLLCNSGANSRTNKVTPLMMGLIPYVCDDWFKTIIKGQNEAAILNFLGGTSETLGKNQLVYKNAQADFVQKNNVQFLDPWTLFEDHKDLMCYDGIHPNEAGYAVLSEAWIKFLSEVKKEF